MRSVLKLCWLEKSKVLLVVAVETNIRYDFGLQVTRRPEIKCAVEYAIALSVIHNSLKLLHMMVEPTLLKQLLKNQLLFMLMQNYFYMVFTCYIFGDSYFHRINKKILHS